MNNKPENHGRTWFWKWFLDNQLVTGLLILLLLLVNLILFSQTSYLLNPIKGFISAIGVPVACGAVIYYLVKPIYDFLVSKKRRGRIGRFQPRRPPARRYRILHQSLARHRQRSRQRHRSLDGQRHPQRSGRPQSMGFGRERHDDRPRIPLRLGRIRRRRRYPRAGNPV